MNMHVKPTSLKLAGGKSYRGKSGAVHRIETSDNSAWPFKTADHELSGSRFWKVDGTGYNTDGWDSHATLGDDLVAPLFAVGDKARAVIGTTLLLVGNEYTVTSASDKDVFVTVKNGNQTHTLSYPHEYFELLPATYTACAAAEVDNLADEYGGGKAGPRDPGYRFTAKDKPQAGDRVSIGDHGTFTVKDVLDNGNIRFTDRPRDLTWLLHENAAISACTLVQAAPTLTIQAGRYYKTRDGRKVGPMVWRFEDSAHPWRGDLANGGIYIFEADGRNYIPGVNDLIAEWPSDDVPLRGVSPVSPVVAPATTAKDAGGGFKAGDRIRLISDPCGDTLVGDEFVAVARTKGVKSSVHFIDKHGHTTWRPGVYFELVASAPTTIADIVRKHSGTAVVMLIENGQPKPSTVPFVHTSAELAGEEATRLASIHKGQEFGVYECVDVRKEEKPAYEHEWQRLAASGQKINAIRELRGMTGLGLATTKSAVEDWLSRQLLAA